MPNGLAFGGPLYGSTLLQQATQRKALTGRGFTPSEYAAISRGELEARYWGELEKGRYEQQRAIQERELTMQEEAAKKRSRAYGISGGAGAGYYAGTALIPDILTAVGLPGAAGSVGAIGGPLGIIIGGLLGGIAGDK